MRKRTLFLVLVCAVVLGAAAAWALRPRAPLPTPLRNPEIHVFKERRQGDRRTPEGRYFICNKNPHSKFYLSLQINYPNEQDAVEGLADGVITAAQHERIVRASRQNRIPPAETRLGGEIFIHGHGSGSDWTWGCIALDDPEMKELFDAIPIGTPVVIVR